MQSTRMLLSVIALAIAAPVAAQLSPEASLAKMKPAEGLEVTLFAAEPDVENPTSLDVDAKGRVWVAEGVNYRVFKNPTIRPEGDRIRILEDTDHDGKCDKATTFYQDPSLFSPMGIAVLGERVYLCKGPDLFYLEDTDGDGKADKKTVILTGFSASDHDHSVHGVMMGPDGLLYFSVGDEGLDITDKQGNRVRVGRAGGENPPYNAGSILRCDRDGNRLELICHGLRNPYEPAVDPYGNVFISDNDDDGNQQTRIVFALEGADYGYWPHRRGNRHLDNIHWNEDLPGITPKILKTGFGSPTGLMFYQGTRLGEARRNTLVHSDAGPGEIRSYHLTPKGAGYSVEPEVILSCPGDKWFRPSDVCAGPDGAVFIADWYDPGVGGHNRGDVTRGRIFRLVAKGSQPQAADLEANQEVRFQRGFNHTQAAKAGSDGAELVMDWYDPGMGGRGETHRRVGALYPQTPEGIKANEGRDANLWNTIPPLMNSDPAVLIRDIKLLSRAGTLRGIFKQLTDLDRDQGPTASPLLTGVFKIERLIENPDPQVRRELLIQLRDIKAPWAIDTIVELAGKYDGEDRFYRSAIGIASRGRESKIWTRLAEKDAGRWEKPFVELTFELHPPEAQALAAQTRADAKAPMERRIEAVRLTWAAGNRESAKTLEGMLRTDTPKPVVLAILDAFKDDQIRGAGEAEENPALLGFLGDAIADPELNAGARKLALDLKMTALIPKLAALAKDGSRPVEGRVAGVEMIGRLGVKEAEEPLVALSAHPDAAIASAATAALGGIPGDSALTAVEEIALDPIRGGAVRKEAIRSLGRTKSGSLLILKLADEGMIPPSLTLEAATVTNGSVYSDVKMLAGQLLPMEQTKDGASLPPVADLMKMTGEGARGELVFRSEDGPQCYKCHKIAGQGADVGPDLSKIGAKLAREAIFESILNPSAAIQHEYEVWIINTKSKGYLNGYLLADTSEGVELVDSTGSLTRIKKDDILERTKSSASLMPTGLSSGMTTQQLVDLVEYLGGLK